MSRILESQQQIQARTEQLERDAIAAPFTSPDSAPSSDGASIDFQALNDAAVMEQKRLEKELKAREYELARQQYQYDRESRAEQQAAQHAQYKAQLAQRKAEAELEQQERIAKLRADRENRYYTCLNPAISQYGYDRAQILCARYK